MRTALLDVAVAAAVLVASVSPCPAANLFALVNTGEIFASADGGLSWTVRGTLPVGDAVGLMAETTSSRLFLATRSGLIYRSTNAGAEWTAIEPVPASDVVDLAFRADGKLVLLTTTGTVYVSSGVGGFVAAGALQASDFVSLASEADGTFYALTRTGHVYASPDAGANWSLRGSITVSNAVALRARAGELFVLTETGDCHKSADGGSGWNVVGTLNQVYGGGLTFDGEAIVAATREGHVAVSTSGSTWTWVGSVNQLTLSALANDTPGVSGVPESPPVVQIALQPPFPNPRPPYGGSIIVQYTLSRSDQVSLTLLDLQGRIVARRAPEQQTAGPRSIRWDPGLLGAGAYLIRVSTRTGSAAGSKFIQLR